MLNYLSFVGNFFLVGGSLSGYRPQEHFWQVMPFLIAFFVLFSTMVFVSNLFHRTRSNLLDVLVLFLNAGVFFGLSHWLIDRSFSEKWVAAVTLRLTAFYIGHVWSERVPQQTEQVRNLLTDPVFLGTAVVVLVVIFGWGPYQAGRRIDKLPHGDAE